MTTDESTDELTPDGYAAVVRELRGPVASIQSYVRTLMARDAELTGAARRTIHQVILQQSLRLDGFVDDVVLYVRLLTKDVEPHPEPVLLASLVEEIRHRLGEPERVVVVGGIDVVLDADRAALGGALRRLVRNGLVFGPRKGHVEVEASSDDSSTTIRVRDAGLGIPEQSTEVAMRPFARHVRPGERRTDGPGLGLAVVRELAGLMGGELLLADAEPGLVASLRLPR